MAAVFITDDGKTVARTKCEIYTRVMGYHRPVSYFNTGKKSEFYSRTYFNCKDNTCFNNDYSE